VGLDADGDVLISALGAKGLDLHALQRDTTHPTGIVQVTLSGSEPTYTIQTGAAWDHLEFTSQWSGLGAEADAVCFGTLAQRHAVSRETIHRFVAATKPGALRFFDVNLRQSYYDRDTITFGLLHATVAKLNADELEAVAALLGWTERGEAACARLLAEFPLEWLAVTRGAAGCELYSRNATIRSVPPSVTCVDAVGAGDAFSATLIVSLLSGIPPQEAADRANRIGAYVATQSGGMPPLPATLLS
jgi:fructokinase